MRLGRLRESALPSVAQVIAQIEPAMSEHPYGSTSGSATASMYAMTLLPHSRGMVGMGARCQRTGSLAHPTPTSILPLRGGGRFLANAAVTSATGMLNNQGNISASPLPNPGARVGSSSHDLMIKLKSGKVYDPAHNVDGEVRDIFVGNGRIVAAPGPGAHVDQEIDCSGMIVMAGAIDMHTHIGGGKVNIARAMLPEDHRARFVRAWRPRQSPARGCGHAAPSTLTTGYRYAEMGYTACFEPAMLPINARQAHMEMGDTPIVDKGGYAMLGSDDFFLRMLAAKARSEGDQRLRGLDAARRAVHRHQSGESRRHQRVQIQSAQARSSMRSTLTTASRRAQILKALAQAVHDLGVPHPLHVHCSQSRRAGQCRHHAGDDAKPPRACRCI